MDKFAEASREIAIDSVEPNAYNPNKQDDMVFEKAKDSITKFGFIVPIIIREEDGKRIIVDGEHRWRAAKELGYTKISAINLGHIGQAEAKALTLLLNNIRGQDDPLKRGELFKLFKAEYPELLELMPFDEQTIAHEIELIDFNMSSYSPDEPETPAMFEGFKFNVEKTEAPRVVKMLESFNKNYDTAFMQIIDFLERTPHN